MDGGRGTGNDPYRVLGVGHGASSAEITRAYRRLARQLHPDSRPGQADAADRFRAISDAYAVLSDPARRAAYEDRLHPPARLSHGRAPGRAGRGAVPPRPGQAAPWPAGRLAADPPLRAGPVHFQPAAPVFGSLSGEGPDELGLLMARLLRSLRSWP